MRALASRVTRVAVGWSRRRNSESMAPPDCNRRHRPAFDARLPRYASAPVKIPRFIFTVHPERERSPGIAGVPPATGRRPAGVQAGGTPAIPGKPRKCVKQDDQSLCILPGAGSGGARVWLDAGAASRVAGGGAQPRARRVRGTPGTRAGGIERRLGRTVALERPEAFDHGPYRVAVAFRGKGQRLGGARAAVSARPSQARHQIEGTSARESLHQRPDGGGATDGCVDQSIVRHRSYRGFVSGRQGMSGTKAAGRVPGSAGVPPARAGGPQWTTRRRPAIVHAGGTPALPAGF